MTRSTGSSNRNITITAKGYEMLAAHARSKRRAKKLITIRLPKKLIADLKAIAKARGIRYQTLINRVLAADVAMRGLESESAR